MFSFLSSLTRYFTGISMLYYFTVHLYAKKLDIANIKTFRIFA